MFLRRILDKNRSLKDKLLMVYLLIILSVVVLLLCISLVYYSDSLKKSYDLLDENARLHETVVQERVDSYTKVFYELIVNSELIQLAEQVDSASESVKSEMKDLMSTSVYSYESIRSISFLTESGNYVNYSRWYLDAYRSIWNDTETVQDAFYAVSGAQSLTYIGVVNIEEKSGNEDYVILMGYPVRNLRTQEESGVLVMGLEISCLLFDDSESEEIEGVTTVITDEEGHIVAGTSSEFINEDYQTWLDKVYGNGKRINVRTQEIEGYPWEINHIIDTFVYQRSIYLTMMVMWLIFFVFALLSFFIGEWILRKYLGSVQELARGIHEFEGTNSEDIHVGMGEQDELYIIVRQFKKMTVRVNDLIRSLEQKNIQIEQEASNRRHAEIKALEAQINPHFLFNTLDSINWIAIEHDEEKISDMLGALGSLLRYSVSNIDILVCFEAEISWLKKYIFLQRDRYGDSFDCEYEISDAAMAFPIYKMLLQPIIENSILHGFENVRQGGMIRLKADVLPDGRLEIRIEDNGCGMRPEILEKIRHNIQENTPLNCESIGISNVISRLWIYYQGEALLQVESEWGRGSAFTMVIPYRE